MKKKIFAVIVLVIVAATMVISMTACSTGIFEVDEDRDYHQVIATVNYKDLSKEIYKGEVYSYVYSYGSYYSQYYSMSAEDIIEYFYNSLTRSALMTLYAKYYAYENFDYIDTTKAITDLDPQDFITLQQYIYCLDSANTDILSSYSSILEDLVDEDEDENTDEDEDEDSDEEELEARTVRTFDEDSSSGYDADSICSSLAIVYGEDYKDITYGQITEDFIVSTLKVASVDSFLDSITAYNVIQAKIDAETVSSTKKSMKSALKKLKENIANSYMSYEYFVEDKIDAVILYNMQNDIKDITIAQEEIDAAYADLLDEQWKSYIDVDDYASAVSDNSWLLVNPSQEYTAVKSILLSFTDEQSAALTAISAMYSSNEDKIVELREMIAIGQYDADGVIEMLLGSEGSGVKVNVSNYLYNSDTDELADAYTDKEVDYRVVLYAMANSIQSITDEIVALYKSDIGYDSMSTEEQAALASTLAAIEYNAYVEAFTQWTYLVNDDSGAFSSDYYVVTPDGTATSFVEEYTVLARELAKNTVNSYAISTTTSAFESSTLTTTGYNNEYLTNNLGTGAYEITVDSCSSTVANSETITANVYTFTTAEGNSVSFCVNTYGIHIVMNLGNFGTSRYVSDDIDMYDEDMNITTDSSSVVAYVYNLTSIREDGVTIKYDYKYTAVATDASFDENETYYVWKAGEYTEVTITEFESGVTYYTASWELKSVTCELKTLQEYLNDELVDNKYTDAYQVKQILLYFEDIDTDAGKYITKNTKVYDNFVKDLTES